MIIDGVKITATNFNPSAAQCKKYLDYVKEKVGVVENIQLTLCADGKVDVEFSTPKFERIRRITGYLTGDLNTWNDAKRAEESERVKHT